MSPSESAVSKGTHAVALVLRRHYLSEHETTAPASDWYPEARECVDAFMLASNPVGESETIYDDYYRLRKAARKVDELIFQNVEANFENEAGWAAINRLRELGK